MASSSTLDYGFNRTLRSQHQTPETPQMCRFHNRIGLLRLQKQHRCANHVQFLSFLAQICGCERFASPCRKKRFIKHQVRSELIHRSIEKSPRSALYIVHNRNFLPKSPESGHDSGKAPKEEKRSSEFGGQTGKRGGGPCEFEGGPGERGGRPPQRALEAQASRGKQCVSTR